jgi:hypothetical protein
MRVQSFALAILATLPLLAHSADSPVIASSAVSLNNLTIQLVDLNPNDGIAPGIQFNSLGRLYALPLYDPDTGEVSYVGPSYTNSLTPTGSLSSTAGNTTSVATPNSLSIGTFTTLAQLTSPEAQVYQTSSSTVSRAFDNSGYFSLLAGPAGSSTGSATFTLTANTAVFIRGNISTSITLDASALSSVFPADQFTWQLTKGEYAGYVYIGLHTEDQISDTESGNVVGYVSQTSSAELSPYLYPDTISSDADPATGLTFSRSASKDFVLQMGNLGDQELTGVLLVDLSAAANLELDTYAVTPPVDPDTPPVVPGIPEPGTWALMGAGMLVLAAVRRQQAQQQARQQG